MESERAAQNLWAPEITPIDLKLNLGGAGEKKA
jgi:hypothetical protein